MAYEIEDIDWSRMPEGAVEFSLETESLCFCWYNADGDFKAEYCDPWRVDRDRDTRPRYKVADYHPDMKSRSNHPENNLEMVGRKHDTAKPRMDLIPPKAEKLLAEVLSYGAQKYAPNNWKHVPDAHDRYIAAAMRHINSHRSGEEIDPESGLPHLAHAMCSLAFILELEA